MTRIPFSIKKASLSRKVLTERGSGEGEVGGKMNLRGAIPKGNSRGRN